jgi:hypothetical protein
MEHCANYSSTILGDSGSHGKIFVDVHDKKLWIHLFIRPSNFGQYAGNKQGNLNADWSIIIGIEISMIFW